jgi:hypothetical protein
MKNGAFVALYLELVRQDAPPQCTHGATMLPAKIQRGPGTLSPEHPTPPRAALYSLLSLSSFVSGLGLSVVYRSYTLEGDQVHPLRGHGVVCGLL